nr:MAG TPA: hypothetical protein [Caudoviricetes sp.]
MAKEEKEKDDVKYPRPQRTSAEYTNSTDFLDGQ